MQSKAFQLLVDNTPGVLSRIVGLFSRRGYNIESITAGVTGDPRFTRITIVTNGDSEVLEQIEKQIQKLEDVRHIMDLSDDDSVFRELCMIKVAAKPADRPGIIGIANVFRAKVVDIAQSSMILELTGTRDKIAAFSAVMGEYEVLELARTGVTGLSRGADKVIWLDT